MEKIGIQKKQGSVVEILKHEILLGNIPSGTEMTQNELATSLGVSRMPVREALILLEYQGTYLVQKRPPKGLLAGLWEFPSQEGFVTTGELSALLEQWNTRADSIELLGRGKHIFSHIEWRMIGYLVHLDQAPAIPLSEESAWVTTEKMQKEYSIPSAFRPYYSKIIS